MLTYRSFMSPQELLDLLRKRHDQVGNLDQHKVIQLRVYNVIRTWIQSFYLDILEDTTLFRNLSEFLKSETILESFNKERDQLLKICQRKVIVFYQETISLAFFLCFLKFEVESTFVLNFFTFILNFFLRGIHFSRQHRQILAMKNPQPHFFTAKKNVDVLI